MASILINITKKFDDVLDWIKNKLGLIDDRFSQTIDAILNIFLDKAQEYSPVLTGELRDSIEIFPEDMGGDIIPMAIQSIWVMFGTEEHDIYPVSAKALYWEGALHPVKHVRHPGTQANNFMNLAYMDGQYEAETELNKFMDWMEE